MNPDAYDDSSSDDQLYFLKGKSEGPDTRPDQTMNDVMASKRFVVLAGIFFFLFFASVFLWIVLFGMLNSANMELGGLVIEVPTLGDYYQVYDEFYMTYDKNRDKLSQMNKDLDISANKDYKVELIAGIQATYEQHPQPTLQVRKWNEHDAGQNVPTAKIDFQTETASPDFGTRLVACGIGQGTRSGDSANSPRKQRRYSGDQRKIFTE